MFPGAALAQTVLATTLIADGLVAALRPHYMIMGENKKMIQQDSGNETISATTPSVDANRARLSHRTYFVRVRQLMCMKRSPPGAHRK